MSYEEAVVREKMKEPDRSSVERYAKSRLQREAQMRKRIAELEQEKARLEEKLYRITQWCQAYPEDIFVPPTKEEWKRAAEALKATDGCPSLDRISGANMRHVVTAIAEHAALPEDE